MQLDQFIRRVAWRVRRRFRPAADNDPIVELESPAVAVAHRPRRRWLGTTLAFVMTLSVLAGGYAAFVANGSRVRLDTSSVAASEPGASLAVAAAARVLAFGGERLAPDDEELVAPSTRRLREERVRIGALRAAGDYVALSAARPGRSEPALEDARAAIAGGDQAPARDALLRFNVRIARGEARMDTAGPALAGILRAAADACEAEAGELSALAAAPALIAPPSMDARVAEARGLAWGWLLILRGALADAPEVAGTVAIESSIPLEALSRIVERQPLFLANGGPGLPWAPSHVAETAADFERAAIGARALADAVESRSP